MNLHETSKRKVIFFPMQPHSQIEPLIKILRTRVHFTYDFYLRKYIIRQYITIIHKFILIFFCFLLFEYKNIPVK